MATEFFYKSVNDNIIQFYEFAFARNYQEIQTLDDM